LRHKLESNIEGTLHVCRVNSYCYLRHNAATYRVAISCWHGLLWENRRINMECKRQTQEACRVSTKERLFWIS